MTATAPVAVMMGTLIVEGACAVAASALAAIVVTDVTSSIDSNSTQSTSTSGLCSAAEAMAHLFTFTLVAAAH
jgi:hypothetical protein